jgi:hypothetical protein
VLADHRGGAENVLSTALLQPIDWCLVLQIRPAIDKERQLHPRVVMSENPKHVVEPRQEFAVA